MLVTDCTLYTVTRAHTRDVYLLTFRHKRH